MRWGLLRRGDYPDAIAREFEHLAEAVRQAFLTDHDTDGRHRRVQGRWNLAGGQALTTAVATRIVCTRPSDDNASDGLDMGTDGILTVRQRGLYLVVGQIRFAANGAGIRAAALRKRQTGYAQTLMVTAGAGSDTRVQVTECLPCDIGDTIELYGTQTSGGALNVTVDVGVLQETFLRVVRVPS